MYEGEIDQLSVCIVLTLNKNSISRSERTKNINIYHSISNSSCTWKSRFISNPIYNLEDGLDRKTECRNYVASFDPPAQSESRIEHNTTSSASAEGRNWQTKCYIRGRMKSIERSAEKKGGDLKVFALTTVQTFNFLSNTKFLQKLFFSSTRFSSATQ